MPVDPPHPLRAASSLRPDIQGLRAVAVVAVVLSHLLGWPAGGFVGVDVFFVISGFLITGLLVRERERRGSISLRGFYARRARRILPAALVVLAATGIGALWALPRARFEEVARDLLASVLFAFNWRAVAVGTDYFAAGAPVSPLQHFWSLAVEEQFYLVWPWLLLAGLAPALARPGRAVAALLVGAITVASFCWAAGESTTAPTVAYFSTASRGWELGVGALVAISGQRWARLPARSRPVLAWLGLLAIGATVVLGPAGAFPAPGALLPVLGAALVLGSAAGGSSPWLAPLTNPLLSWVGDRSYSLYLWHLPVIVLLPALVPLHGAAAAVVEAALTVVLAAASFTLVEEPIRRRRERSTVTLRRPAVGAWITTGAAAALLVALGGAAILPQPTEASSRTEAAPPHASSAPPSSVPRRSAAAAPDPQVVLTSRLETALRAKVWPTLEPSVDALDASARVPEWSRDDCLVVTSRKLARCTWGAASAPLAAVVVGDSAAVSWLPALRRALEPVGYRVVSLTMGQCPAAEVDVKDTGGSAAFAPQCRAHLDWDVAQIRRLHPQLVLATSAAETLYRLVSGASGATARRLWERGQAAFADRLRGVARHVVVVDPAPQRVPLADCATRFSSPSDCVSPVGDDYLAFTVATARAAAAAGVPSLHTAPWFCVDGRCPAFVGHTPVYVDRVHLTGAFAPQLAGVFAASLDRLGALSGSAAGGTR